MVDRRQISPYVFFAIAGGVISCLSSRTSPLNDRFGRPDALFVHYEFRKEEGTLIPIVCFAYFLSYHLVD
ncbi:expressed protein [Echinococcus multilocularis]|uniref:Expressed protein n=1 Tax=Echinococcus multilocularis TaxID=6211 RepID=A0A068XUE6_ECHMU|nr:expressed protein [Echinococcus multilocularis]